jgi:hypothetical protein
LDSLKEKLSPQVKSCRLLPAATAFKRKPFSPGQELPSTPSGHGISADGTKLLVRSTYAWRSDDGGSTWAQGRDSKHNRVCESFKIIANHSVSVQIIPKVLYE